MARSSGRSAEARVPATWVCRAASPLTTRAGSSWSIPAARASSSTRRSKTASSSRNIAASSAATALRTASSRSRWGSRSMVADGSTWPTPRTIASRYGATEVPTMEQRRSRTQTMTACGALWLILAAVPALADGGPHVLTTNNGSLGLNADGCAGCHRAHTAQGPMLLTAEDATALCKTCHGASVTGATTDVMTGVQYALAGRADSAQLGT